MPLIIVTITFKELKLILRKNHGTQKWPLFDEHGVNGTIYLTGPNLVGLNFSRPKFLVGPNFSHQDRIWSLRAD